MSDIQKLAEQMDLRVRSYSGRGMMGKTCLGIVVSSNEEILELFYNLGKACMEYPEVTRSDNMGFDTIFYFPYIEYVKNLEDDEEYDDGYGDGFADDDENED